MGKSMVSCRFSLKPIHWWLCWFTACYGRSPRRGFSEPHGIIHLEGQAVFLGQHDPQLWTTWLLEAYSHSSRFFLATILVMCPGHVLDSVGWWRCIPDVMHSPMFTALLQNQISWTPGAPPIPTDNTAHHISRVSTVIHPSVSLLHPHYIYIYIYNTYMYNIYLYICIIYIYIHSGELVGFPPTFDA